MDFCRTCWSAARRELAAHWWVGGGAMPHYRVTGYIRIDDEDMSGGPVFGTTLT